MTYPPDFMGALIAYIRESPDVQAVAGGTSPRVSASLQSAWSMPTLAVVLTAAAGGPALMASHDRPRVDIYCYGTDARTANDLARRVDGWLFPEPGARASGFKRAHALVSTIEKEGGPSALPPDATAWPAALLTVRPSVARQPV